MDEEQLGQHLLQSNLILTALELHQELAESRGEGLKCVEEFFANWDALPAKEEDADERIDPLEASILGLANRQPLSSLHMELKKKDESVAMLRYELRLAYEDNQTLRQQLVTAKSAITLPSSLSIKKNAGVTTPPKQPKEPKQQQRAVAASSVSIPLSSSSSSVASEDSDEVVDMQQILAAPLSEPEQNQLNNLVRQYLSARDYRMTALTFADEADSSNGNSSLPSSGAADSEVAMTATAHDLIQILRLASVLPSQVQHLQQQVHSQQQLLKSSSSNSNASVSAAAAELSPHTMLSALKTTEENWKESERVNRALQKEIDVHVSELDHLKTDLQELKQKLSGKEAEVEQLKKQISSIGYDSSSQSRRLHPSSSSLPSSSSAPVAPAATLASPQAPLPQLADNNSSVLSKLILDHIPSIASNLLAANRHELLPLITTAALHSEDPLSIVIPQIMSLIKKPEETQRKALIDSVLSVCKKVSITPESLESKVILPLFSSISGDKQHTERKLVVASLLGPLCSLCHSSDSFCSSLLKSIVLPKLLELTSDPSSPLIRETSTRSLSTVIDLLLSSSCSPSAAAAAAASDNPLLLCSQLQDTLLSLLKDESLSVVRAAQHNLLPRIAQWSESVGGSFHSQLFQKLLALLQSAAELALSPPLPPPGAATAAAGSSEPQPPSSGQYAVQMQAHAKKSCERLLLCSQSLSSLLPLLYRFAIRSAPPASVQALLDPSELSSLSIDSQYRLCFDRYVEFVSPCAPSLSDAPPVQKPRVPGPSFVPWAAATWTCVELPPRFASCLTSCFAVADRFSLASAKDLNSSSNSDDSSSIGNIQQELSSLLHCFCSTFGYPWTSRILKNSVLDVLEGHSAIPPLADLTGRNNDNIADDESDSEHREPLSDLEVARLCILPPFCSIVLAFIDDHIIMAQSSSSSPSTPPTGAKETYSYLKSLTVSISLEQNGWHQRDIEALQAAVVSCCASSSSPGSTMMLEDVLAVAWDLTVHSSPDVRLNVVRGLFSSLLRIIPLEEVNKSVLPAMLSMCSSDSDLDVRVATLPVLASIISLQQPIGSRESVFDKVWPVVRPFLTIGVSPSTITTTTYASISEAIKLLASVSLSFRLSLPYLESILPLVASIACSGLKSAALQATAAVVVDHDFEFHQRKRFVGSLLDFYKTFTSPVPPVLLSASSFSSSSSLSVVPSSSSADSLISRLIIQPLRTLLHESISEGLLDPSFIKASNNGAGFALFREFVAAISLPSISSQRESLDKETDKILKEKMRSASMISRVSLGSSNSNSSSSSASGSAGSSDNTGRSTPIMGGLSSGSSGSGGIDGSSGRTSLSASSSSDSPAMMPSSAAGVAAAKITSAFSEMMQGLKRS